VVLSKLESGTLRELADSTNGAYQDASNWIDLAALVTSTVESGKQGEFMEKNTVRLVERFQWPLALALWCLLVSFYYEFPVRPRPRDLKLTTEAPKASNRQGLTALLLFSLLAFSMMSHRAVAADDMHAAPAPTPLAVIVSRLSTSAQPTARDWAELSRETVTWGSKLQSGQQPVPAGPIRDALTAVELGRKLDPKTADWPKLREELEALLKKPDEQEQKNDQNEKKDQEQQQDQQNQKQNEQNQDQNKQDSDQKKRDQSQEQKDQSQSEKSSEQKDSPDSKSQPKDSQDKDSAFGDMKKQEQPPSPPPTEDTQKVGGAPKSEQQDATPIDPSLALPLQKLDQLRNQDSPAELFKLMEGEKNSTPKKKTKDW